MTFTARRLLASDAEAYRAIRLEGLELSPASFGSSLAEEGAQPTQWFADRLGRSFLFGLFDGDVLVGTAGFFRETGIKTEHRGKLVGVYLRPSARGGGNASLLLAAVIAEARNHVLQLSLAVTQDDEKARRLYERHGFRIYGEDPRGLRVGGIFYDDYLMVLRLDGGGTESDK